MSDKVRVSDFLPIKKRLQERQDSRKAVCAVLGHKWKEPVFLGLYWRTVCLRCNVMSKPFIVQDGEIVYREGKTSE
jgi:hypothetical protein